MKQIDLMIFLFTNVFKEAMPSSIDVCLSSSVYSNQMTFVCKIDDLHLPVYFFDNHNEEIAHCTIPHPFPKCTTVKRDNATVSVVQFPQQNETILFIEETTDHRANGNWSCHHGKNLYLANVHINIKKTKDECKCNRDGHENDNTSDIVGWTLVLAVAICIFVLTCIYHKTQDTLPIRHCAVAGAVLEQLRLPPDPETFNSLLDCGIAYLMDGTVVVIDGHNYEFILFKSQENQSFVNIKPTNDHKPAAITAMRGNEFAVTYPHEMYIQINELKKNQTTYDVLVLNKINIPEYKPYTIAYNEGLFAVETDKDEVKHIRIVDIKEKEIINSINCHDFKKCTIRLALGKHQIFVSVMETGIVLCMGFDGSILWNRDIHGPNDIIISEDCFSNGKVILSSKTANAIYEWRRKEEHTEIVKAIDLDSCPKNIAYHSATKTLCVLVEIVENVTLKNKKMLFLKFKEDTKLANITNV